MGKEKRFHLNDAEAEAADRAKQMLGLTDRQAYLRGLGLEAEPRRVGRPTLDEIRARVRTYIGPDGVEYVDSTRHSYGRELLRDKNLCEFDEGKFKGKRRGEE